MLMIMNNQKQTAQNFFLSILAGLLLIQTSSFGMTSESFSILKPDQKTLADQWNYHRRLAEKEAAYKKLYKTSSFGAGFATGCWGIIGSITGILGYQNKDFICCSVSIASLACAATGVGQYLKNWASITKKIKAYDPKKEALKNKQHRTYIQGIVTATGCLATAFLFLKCKSKLSGKN